MKKPILLIALIALFIFTALIFTFTLSASAAVLESGSCGTNLTYTIDSYGTLTISGTGDMTDWTSYSTAPWYSKRSSIKKVVITDGVTSIGKSSFYSCTVLTIITIPDSVTSIGEMAFWDCTSLTSINIPDSVTNIGNSAFRHTSFYNNSDNWENNVLYIGNHLIAAKSSISGSYTIKNGTKTIADNAFLECDNLTNIIIPDSIIIIGDGAFYGCEKLSSVKFGKYSKLAKMGDYSFRYCSSLNSISIPSGVSHIGKLSFDICRSLTSVTFPEDSQLTSIEYGTFNDCSSLTSISIPDSVTSIGDSAFEDCTNLKNVYITNIAAWCNIDFYNLFSSPLYYAKNLYVNGTLATDIDIPTGVISIGQEAFYNCTSLESVTISESVEFINDSAFSTCLNLTKITVNDNNKSYSSDERGVLFNKAKTTLIQYPLGNTNTSYQIPSSVTCIDDRAFSNCASLSMITFGVNSMLTSIGDWAFSYCESLTTITIPDGVTSIGSGAFRDCTSLASIVIPYGVTSINGLTFINCKSLTNITIYDSITSISSQAFQLCDKLTNVYYTGDKANWNNISIGHSNSNLTEAAIHYNYIPIISSGKCGENIAWILRENGTLNISGTGAMNNFTTSTIPWAEYRDIIKKVIIEDGVTNIGNYAFYNCTALESAEIADSVTSIKNVAFNGCTSLTEITLPKKLTTIGASAFNKCSSLAEIVIDENVKTIGTSAFANCPELTIYAYSDTAGEAYAKSNNISYVRLFRKYNVTYDANGGENAPDVQVKTEDTELVLSEETPTLAYYEFKGWSTSENREVEYLPGEVCNENKNVTLYAVWSPCIYKVTFDANGGTVNTQSINVAYNSQYGTLPVPERYGYNFAGWYTAAEGGSEIIENTVIYNYSAHTLYAHWSLKIYTISYDANGGNNAPFAQTKTHGQPLTLTNLVPVHDEYEFVGWSTLPDGSAEYQPRDYYIDNGDITLYAVWSSGIIYGDISGDGNVNISDVINLLQCLAGNMILVDENKKIAADVDCDGFINISDAICILQFLASPGVALGPTT